MTTTGDSATTRDIHSSLISEAVLLSNSNILQLTFTKAILSQFHLISMTPGVLNEYVIHETIGSGASSKVKVADRISTGDRFAIKIVEKSDVFERPGFDAKVREEAALMGTLNHPHILKLVDAFEDCNHHYLVTEYATHGELFEYLVARKSLSPATAMHFFRQLIYGVEYLHARSIAHCDLKPENLLLDANDCLKIGDFGFARQSKEGVVQTACGSLHYLAPEAFAGEPYDGRKADIWSCGVILFTLLTGRLPFVDPSERALAAKIRAARIAMPSLPSEIRDLVTKILTANVKMRYSIAQIKEHSAFRIGLPKDYQLPQLLPFQEGKVQFSAKTEIETLPWPRRAVAVGVPDTEVVRVIDDVKHRCEFVMRTVQKCTGGAGFDWFHPDDTELICRRPSDGLAMRMDVQGSDAKATVRLRLVGGDEAAFRLFVSRIVTAVQRMPADQP